MKHQYSGGHEHDKTLMRITQDNDGECIKYVCRDCRRIISTAINTDNMTWRDIRYLPVMYSVDGKPPRVLYGLLEFIYNKWQDERQKLKLAKAMLTPEQIEALNKKIDEVVYE